jgi:hypothetical protein
LSVELADPVAALGSNTGAAVGITANLERSHARAPSRLILAG